MLSCFPFKSEVQKSKLEIILHEEVLSHCLCTFVRTVIQYSSFYTYTRALSQVRNFNCKHVKLMLCVISNAHADFFLLS